MLLLTVMALMLLLFRLLLHIVVSITCGVFVVIVCTVGDAVTRVQFVSFAVVGILILYVLCLIAVSLIL